MIVTRHFSLHTGTFLSPLHMANRLSGILLAVGCLLLTATGCTRSFEDEWTSLIPEDAIALYLPFDGETAQMAPQSESAGLFRQPVSGTAYAPDVPYTGLILMADLSTGISPAWIVSADTEINPNWASVLSDQRVETPITETQEPSVIKTGEPSASESIRLTQDHYQFQGKKITMYGGSTVQNTFYSAKIGDYVILSPSPRAVEKFISRAEQPGEVLSAGFGRYLPDKLLPGDLILNPDELDAWASTFSNVLYHPVLSKAFEGAEPMLLRSTPMTTKSGTGWTLSGEMILSESISESSAGRLTRKLSGRAEELKLDRYITNNAAVYSIVRISAEQAEEWLDPSLSERPVFTRRPSLFDDLRNAPSSETAYIGLSESGFQAGSEEIFIRALRNPSALRRVLNEMVAAGEVDMEGRLYVLNTPEIARYLTGRIFAPGERFYLDVFEDAVVLSTRAGLTESVRDDASRRNVLRYHPDYLTLMESNGRNVSFIASVRTERFFPFITPWLQAGRMAQALESLEFLKRNGQYTLIGMREELEDPVQVTLIATSTAEEVQPYRELWVYPLPDVELSGKPIFANMGGSERPEIMFSTKSGSVVVLAADGTSILQLSTGADTPVGSPVAYDWYGTRQNVLLQAAGSSVYGWDQNGNRLPGFPIRLQERILSPLQVADITRNGLPELVLSTADRAVHVLQARGESVPGWPQIMNSTITGSPVLHSHNGGTTLFAVAQNTLHGWSANGDPLPGYPYFESQPFSAEPVVMSQERLLLATQGGSLLILPAYPDEADFKGSTFAGNQSQQRNQDPSESRSTGQENRLLKTIPASQSGITGKPLFLPNERISISTLETLTSDILSTLTPEQRDSLQSARSWIREDLLIASSPQGSLYAYSSDGELRFIQNMGQDVSEFSPTLIQDINRDQLPELISTGRFGRLFAWTLANSERILDLPTNGMEYPVFTDLDLDQRMELIALTREGLRCWTLQ